MSGAVHRLAYLVSHPIQYQAPLLRHLAAQPDLDLEVLFLSDVSAGRHTDRGFGTEVEWDVPLLDGYAHVFLDSWYRTSRINFAEPLVRGLRRHLAEGEFDALWVHGWYHQVNLRAMSTARELGMRVLLRGESFVRGRRSRVRDALQRRVLGLADAYLAIGSLNHRFYRYHGIGTEHIFDVPYAVDNAFFRERALAASRTREELRSELDLEPGRPVVLYAAKLLRHKRPDDLLRAYEEISPGGREPDPYLLFVGDGPERQRLETRAASNGWSSIRFLGFKNQTELPRLYDLCDVFVLPSDHEPWGLVVNEVMNAGRPVITTDCVGASMDLITEGVNGFTVPVGDTASLAERLREVLSDDVLRKAMGRASLEMISDWDFARDYRGLASALGNEQRKLAA